MTLTDVVEHWDNIDGNVKIMALNRVISEGLNQFVKGDETFVKSIFTIAVDYENEDGFGTERLNV